MLTRAFKTSRVVLGLGIFCLSVGIVSAQIFWDGPAQDPGQGICLKALRERPFPRPPIPLVVAHSPGNPAGVPNFRLISRGLFRSAQPRGEGFSTLKKMGIRTILNLTLHPSADAPAARLGMRVVNAPMNGVLAPSFGEMDRAIRIMTDPAKRPLLVHCHYGRDRTGVVAAAYRIVVERWSVEDAAMEAESFGCCPVTFKDLRAYLADYREHYFR